MSVSVTEPVSRAMNRAIDMTFRPFQVGRWFTIGFIAWLASLGESGSSFNSNIGGGGGGGGGGPAPAPAPPGPGGTPSASGVPTPPTAREAWDWVTANPALSIAIAGAVLAVLLAIVLVLTWLSSRGRFMLIHAIANNSDEVRRPWREHRAAGNSLFKFRAILLVAGFLVFAIALGVAGWIAWPDVQAQDFGPSAISAIIAGALILIPLTVALALILWATNSFVAVIMYSRGCGVIAGWREFHHDVLRGNVGTFVLFLLMHMLLGIGVIIGQTIIGCGTCCIGFLPYLGTVLTLPLVLFLASYPIYFMQQFGPQYLIVNETPRIPAGGFPVVGVDYPPPPPPPPQQ